MKSVLTGILVVVLSVPVAMAASRGIRIVSNEGEQVGEYQASYALLIGVSDYTAGWPDLQSVPEELVKVSTSLADRGFEITQLHNPTTDELSQGFKDFINRHGYKRDNRLLFFFSGHGYTRDNGKKGYLVPSDAPDPRRDEEGFLRKSYPMTDLLALARNIESNHALFLFDSCFSGTIFQTRALPDKPPLIDLLTSKPVRQFITAGDAGEEVPANSVFTPAFIDALEYGLGDLNGDGYVTGTELGLYLQSEVSLHVKQTPQFGKITDYELSRGDFVFELANAPTVTARSPDSEKEQGGVSGFLEQLQEKDKQDKIEAEKNLTEMQESYEEIVVFSQRDDMSKEAKIEAWRYFLANYAEDNTNSQRDEEMRSEANRYLSELEAGDVRTDVSRTEDRPASAEKDSIQQAGKSDQRNDSSDVQSGLVRLIALTQQQGTSRRAKIRAWQQFLESAQKNAGGGRAADKDLIATARRGLKYVRAGRVTDDKQALRRRGAEYLRKGSYVLAIQEYSWLIEADPKDADAYLKRASAFQHRGQLDLALRDYTQALALNANLVHAYFGRASIYRAKGQSSLAKKELLKLARLDRRTIAAANLSDEQLKTLQALQKTIRSEQKKRTSQQGRKERKF